MKRKALFINVDDIVEFIMPEIDPQEEILWKHLTKGRLAWKFEENALKTIRDVLDQDTKIVLIHNAFDVNDGHIKPTEYREFINDLMENIVLFCTNTEYNRKNFLNTADVFYDTFVADNPDHPYAFPNVMPFQKVAEEYRVNLKESMILVNPKLFSDEALIQRLELKEVVIK